MADQERYGSRTERRQEMLQRDMLRLLNEAAAEAALDCPDWSRQEGGDCEFAVLPEDVDDARVVSDFIYELDIALGDYNIDLRPEARLRLRVAFVHGISIEGANGRAGQAPVSAARLVNATVVKQALAEAQEANLVVVVDDRLYADVVCQRLRGLRPETWTRIQIKDKEFDAPAYVRVPRYQLAVVDAQPDAADSDGPVNSSGHPGHDHPLHLRRATSMSLDMR
jgi:hypothetical protein